MFKKKIKNDMYLTSLMRSKRKIKWGQNVSLLGKDGKTNQTKI